MCLAGYVTPLLLLLVAIAQPATVHWPVRGPFFLCLFQPQTRNPPSPINDDPALKVVLPPTWHRWKRSTLQLDELLHNIRGTKFFSMSPALFLAIIPLFFRPCHMNIRWMTSMSSMTSSSGCATFSPRFYAARMLTVLVR